MADLKKAITVTHNGKIVTSAIEDMTVAETRKLLGESRKAWRNCGHTDEHDGARAQIPFYLSCKLSNGMTMEEFAVRYQVGQYVKRQSSAAVKK